MSAPAQSNPPAKNSTDEMPETRRVLLGSVAALVTILIWGSWLNITRMGVTSSLTPGDTAILRFVIASLVLVPVIYAQTLFGRTIFGEGDGFDFRALGWRRGILLTVTGGALFITVVSIGMKYAPIADVGAMLPGSMPMFVALFGVLFFGQKIGPAKGAAFAIIVGGVLVFAWEGVSQAGDGRWRGHLLLLTGAASWAVFTHALRSANLTAIKTAFLINIGSIPFLPLLFWQSGSTLLTAPYQDIILQGVFQGVISGVIAMITYTAAIRLIGPSASLFAALTPGIAMLIGIPLLGEQPEVIEVLAIVAICFGLAWSAKAK